MSILHARHAASGSVARLVVLVALAIAIAQVPGCSQPRTLMPTPNLYVDAPTDPFADVPPSRRTTTVDLLYVTDRSPEEDDDGKLAYGWQRSHSVAFGSCVVELGRDLTWDELVEQSRLAKRTKSPPLSIVSIEELGRLEPTPTPLVNIDGKTVEAPEAAQAREQKAKELFAELDRRLAETSRKEVYLFVHGYKNTFENAAFALAELWHFLGREGVPILFTWPAGSPGMLRGYNHDRESGEFSIFHLKQVIRALAAHPGIEHLRVIAHSRGTDVCGSALRELFIEARAAGQDPRDRFRIGDLVLAAPDLDLDVVLQRFTAERFGLSVDRLTMYVSENDKAIGIADWLFSSRQRLGRLRAADIEERLWSTIDETPQACIIDARFKSADPNRHSYFRTNPSVSSDVILLLRYGCDPGAEHGRPLAHAERSFHTLEEGYPFGWPAALGPGAPTPQVTK